MSVASETHNELVKEIIIMIGQRVNGDHVQMNIVAESILLGTAMFNYPNDPRNQAFIIQEISDAAQDRTGVVRA